jgi:hypothetical protein
MLSLNTVSALLWTDLAHKSAVRQKPRIRCAMSKKEAHSYLLNLALRLNVNLGEADIEETRRILGKGKPLSAIVKEMRER